MLVIMFINILKVHLKMKFQRTASLSINYSRWQAHFWYVISDGLGQSSCIRL